MTCRAAAILGTILATWAGPALAACEGVVPAAARPGPRRAVTTRDLALLRDVGHPDADTDEASPLGVSPDGRHIAFVINRNEPDGNRVCRALVVIDRTGKQSPRLIDRGGELPQLKDIYRGMYVTTGFPALAVPAWSPDGRWIAYLKRIRGRTQVWRVQADGQAAAVVTRSSSDVEAVAWSSDGRRILFVNRPGVPAGEARLDAEALTGYHYDHRVVLDVDSRPNLPADTVPLVAWSIDPQSGRVVPADPNEQSRLGPHTEDYSSNRSRGVAVPGREAWTTKTGDNPLGPLRLWTRIAGREAVACALPECTGAILNLWWEPDGALLWFRREGWNRETIALYRWRPGAAVARAVVKTTDALTGCLLSSGELLCGRENAVTPRRLVAIDTSSGKSRLLFDPNPEFGQLVLGQVKRLHWRNDRGLPVWGDLVVPPGYDGKAKLPLVAVVYYSRGFLRGGVGDEYPIFPLAARGFAVLSIQRPPHVASTLSGIRSYDDVNGAGRKDWAERRSILSAVMTGIDLVIARGVADPTKLGITGLSDGATNAIFAMIHTRRFAAAVISSCCDGPLSNLAIGGTAWADWNHRVMGYPLTIANDRAFWKPFALALNATEVSTPLLMQLADREALLALEAYAALREARKPIDLFIFPDEYHYKWQPAHRLAIYDRNIDWFAFWLQGRRNQDPAKREQSERWEQMRAAAEQVEAAQP